MQPDSRQQTVIPFFIFSDARSGSNLLARLLVDRYAVAVPPESRFLPDVLEKKFSRVRLVKVLQLIGILSGDRKFKDWELQTVPLFLALMSGRLTGSADMVAVLMRQYAGKINIPASGPLYFGFKKGSYQWHADSIIAAYPEAKILYLVRDGRAVFASKKRSRHSETGEPFETDAARAAQQWMRCMENMARLCARYPDRVRPVYYEALLADPETIIAGIGTFLGIEERAHEHTITYSVPERYAALHGNVHNDIMDTRADAWREELSPAEVATYEQAAGRMLAAQGYVLVSGEQGGD